MTEQKRIGDILIERGLIDPATAELIETERMLRRSRFLSAAVASGRVSEHEALTALAVQDGLPAVDLGRCVLSTAVVRRVPVEVARQHLILPVREDGNHLLVAMASPKDRNVLDELAFATGMTVLPHVALHSRLTEIIPRAHSALTAFYRAPLAPEEIAPGQEYVPIISDDRAAPPAVDIEVVIDTDDLAEVEPDAVQEVPAPVAPAPTTQKKLVLVVEDDAEIAHLVGATIGQLGHDVLIAGRGLDALRLIKQRRPDLIVLDAMLPEVHGFEICRKVKESKRFGATPVLMISAIYRGWRLAEDIKATYRVDAFLEKPFRVADLRRAAQQLLERGAVTAQDDAKLGNEALALARDAKAALARGEVDVATEKLRRAESLEPFSASIQFLVAAALEKREKPFQAIFHYERAIELKPDFFAAARNAAALYQSRGFKNKAAEMWERALHSAPTQETKDQIKQYLMSLL